MTTSNKNPLPDTVIAPIIESAQMDHANEFAAGLRHRIKIGLPRNQGFPLPQAERPAMPFPQALPAFFTGQAVEISLWTPKHNRRSA
ncbi:hypothetical protein [Ralstonia pseudosolanacearum]|uniref:hypothetical protein n=1 Tax=Ralstonia pseudosolanacearum TaxID=1310165 RepID=UPI00386DCBCF